MFVGKELCCHLAIQLFASGRAEYYDGVGGGVRPAGLGFFWDELN